jgi:rod shape-determining protein MreC
MSRLGVNVNRYARGGGSRRRAAAPRRWLTVFIAIAIFIALVKTWTLVTGRTNFVDRGINVLATPLVLAVRYTGEGILSIGHVFRLPTLLRENRTLKAENDQLKRQIAETELVRSSNDDLRRALQLKRTDFRQVNAVVIGRSYDLWLDQVIVNVGYADGVREGQLVVNTDGVVGIVDKKVEDGTAWVTLLTSPRFRMAAVTGQSQVEGVIRGLDSRSMQLEGIRAKAGDAASGNLELMHVKSGAQVKVGEKVFSSGVVGIPGAVRRPRGVLIGTVIHRNIDPNGFLEVRVEPAVNPNRISTVAVMTQ